MVCMKGCIEIVIVKFNFWQTSKVAFMKYRTLILLVCLLSMSGCRSKNDYKVFKSNFPLSAVSFFSLHIGEEEYIMEVPDGIISSGKVEKKGNYYILTDELSNEIMYAKKVDDFITLPS